MPNVNDPIWEVIGTIATIIFGLIGGVGVVFEFKKLIQSHKQLSYDISTETNLLSINDEIKGKVKILYNDIPLQNAYLLVVTIANSGRAPILSSDFERPLSFYLGDKANIISAEIIETSPASLKPEIVAASGTVVLKPILLNSNDTISIKILVTEYAGLIKSDVRIIGVKDLKKLNIAPYYESTFMIQINRILAIISLISFLIIIGQTIIYPNIELPLVIKASFIMTLGYFAGAILLYSRKK